MTSNLSSSSWYRTTPDVANVAPEIAEQAVEWLMTLQDEPVPPHVIEEWRRWRAQHPDHERAWQRIEAVKGNLRPLFSPLNAAVTQATLTQAAINPKRSEHRRRTVKAIALLLVTGGAGYMVEKNTPWRVWSADYRTQIGERQTVTLEDGTQVVMNADSAMDVQFNATERRVKLVSGEVLVRTADTADRLGRPFLVETAQGTARALGTWYAVRQQDVQTVVSVFKGAVQIQLRQQSQPARVLQAGYQASYTDVAISPSEQADETQIAWRDGFIEARSMRLGDFLVELGRYSTDMLTCDPAIADLRVSGSFPLKDVDLVLESLTATLGVHVEKITRLWGRRMIRMVPAVPTAQS